MSTDSSASLVATTVRQFSSICLLAEIYGFKPDPSWRIATGVAGLRDWGRPRYWWEHRTIRKFRGFQTSARIRFEAALERFLEDEGKAVRVVCNPTDLDSRTVALRELVAELPTTQVSNFLDYSRSGPWTWKVPGKSQDFRPTRGQPAPDPNFEIPIDIPREDQHLGFEEELSLSSEVVRLGRDPEERKLSPMMIGIELTHEAWRNVLLTSRAYGFRPKDKQWDRWAIYYRFRNPSVVHFEVNTGFVRIPAFDRVDSREFAAGLRAAHQDRFSRATQFLKESEISDVSVALGNAVSRVPSSLADSIADLNRLGKFRWTVYKDGIVQLRVG